MAKTRGTSDGSEGLESLMKVLPPPKAPANTPNRERRAQVEQELGSKLPDDYWQFGCVYGSGSFAQHGIFISNATADDYMKRVRHNLETLTVWQARPHIKPPYPIFPDNPGLLPFGSDVGNVTYSWLADGDTNPNKWPLVIIRDGTVAEEYTMTFSEFFVRYLTNKIKSKKVVPPPTLPDDLVFVPLPG